ncbi:MAG TPA: bifunctional UDP-N-acetylglucosamine diphosphorylase/glucosamine-1-phosphate N-acetyltransferase GlmU [Dissulfurispiraceae bacterium]|nr:bifunctional UDP-N-acetylglucosamine diphosphorylase/glucosamine-1-phosphate N-acetyltransferase GlmU [Dissulfurispiraceae bacterium]
MKPASVVLAAGQGTRMKSTLPKVLHPLFAKPMVQYVVEALLALKPEKTIIVTGMEGQRIRDTLQNYPVSFAVQKEPRGTGDALKSALQKLRGFTGTLLVVSGDTPLIKPATLQAFLKLHRKRRKELSLISFITGSKHSYGRIVRESNKLSAIVEDKDADEEQKKILEVNSGIYAIEAPLLKLLNKITVNSAKGEYYLTDIVGLAVGRGCRAGAFLLGNENELTGINTRGDLYRAVHYLRDEIADRLMENGVTFIDKASVFIDPGSVIGTETVIYPNVHIEGRTFIGSGCIVYPNSRITDCTIGNNVIIRDSTVIDSSVINEGASIGPFARIRPGSVIGKHAKIGNFVEVKKSVIGDGTKASHLSYLGDAEIGEQVNIGAGTITCNYDGRIKSRTLIEDNVFIGSDTQLVAPVRIEKGAYVGAGSTITRDVPPFALAVSRTPQKNIEKWVIKRQSKLRKGEKEKR